MCFNKSGKRLQVLEQDLYVAKQGAWVSDDKFDCLYRPFRYRKGVLYSKKALHIKRAISRQSLNGEVFHTFDLDSSKKYINDAEGMGVFKIPALSLYWENVTVGEIACSDIMYIGNSKAAFKKLLQQ